MHWEVIKDYAGCLMAGWQTVVKRRCLSVTDILMEWDVNEKMLVMNCGDTTLYMISCELCRYSIIYDLMWIVML